MTLTDRLIMCAILLFAAVGSHTVGRWLESQLTRLAEYLKERYK